MQVSDHFLNFSIAAMLSPTRTAVDHQQTIDPNRMLFQHEGSIPIKTPASSRRFNLQICTNPNPAASLVTAPPALVTQWRAWFDGKPGREGKVTMHRSG